MLRGTVLRTYSILMLTPRTVYAIKPYQVEGTACAYVCRVRVPDRRLAFACVVLDA